MKIVSSSAMAEIDKAAQEQYAYPSALLMENAGLKGCLKLEEDLFGAGSLSGPLVLVAGKGNNGGDAFVMARQYYLRGRSDITLILASGEPGGGDPLMNLEICRKLGIPVEDFTRDSAACLKVLSRGSWIFDGIAGTGLRGELKRELLPLIRGINSSQGKVIAIDVPSGIGDQYKIGYLCVEATVTLTMGLPKKCLYLPRARAHCGRILVVPLGFPPALVQDETIPGDLLEEKDLKSLNPPLPEEEYKKSRGHLGVFAGTTGTAGAAWLASHAAARSRAGMVTLYCDRALYPHLAGAYKSVMLAPWNSLEPPEKKFDALLIGPGWGLEKEKAVWLGKRLAEETPLVLDADALTLLSRLPPGEIIPPVVLTPHPGEFSRLAGVPVSKVLEDPYTLLEKVSRELNCVIVLKGHVTIIQSPEGKYSLLDGMNPALGTGGSGDVLAGLIGGFLAGGLAPFDAARKGVLVHHLCGKQAFAEKGWFPAEDLMSFISLILKEEVK